MQMLFGILVSRHKPFVFSVSSSWGPLKCQPNGHVILQSSNLHIDSSAIYGGVQLYLHAFGNVAHRPYACVDGHIRILCASAVRLLFISRFFFANLTGFINWTVGLNWFNQFNQFETGR